MCTAEEGTDSKATPSTAATQMQDWRSCSGYLGLPTSRESDTIPRLEWGWTHLSPCCGAGAQGLPSSQPTECLCSAKETKVIRELPSPPCPALPRARPQRENPGKHVAWHLRKERGKRKGGTFGSSRSGRKQGHLCRGGPGSLSERTGS